MQAFCLAAGLGERLRPLTAHVPKPLFPVMGRANLGTILEKLQAAGVERLVLNTFHLHERIEEFLKTHYPHCLISREERLLGTGGGLMRAARFLDQDHPILVVNSDIVFDFPLNQLLEIHEKKHSIATLLLTDYPPKNTVLVREGGVVGFKKSADALCFTGISVIEPEALRYCPHTWPFSLVDIFKNAMESNRRISYLKAEVAYPGFYWHDIGTPRAYLKCHGALLEKMGLVHGDQWNWIDQGAEIGPRTILNRCVVWKGSVVSMPGRYEDMIFTPYGVLDARNCS